VELPDFPYAEVTQTISGAEAYAAFDEFVASGRTAELKARKAHGHRLAAAVLPAHDYIRAQRIRRLIADSVSELAGRYDALLAPSLGVVACRIDEDFEYGLPRASGRRPLNLAGVLSGAPTVSILNGFGEGGLPTGIQFAGAPCAENAILDAAHALEQRLGLSRLRPPLAAAASPGPPHGRAAT
jgi:aspartyl-tRNA(Asn)/glutamyl-tRNA(Gln) amidotransferase subunit A